MLWPLGRAKVSSIALAMEYSLSVALGLKRLDTPSLADLSQITKHNPLMHYRLIKLLCNSCTNSAKKQQLKSSHP